MFLLEMERIDRQLQEVKENYSIADRDYQEAKESYEQIKTEYEKLEQDMAAEDEKINAIRDEMSQSAVTKNRLESQIEILNEQIRSAEHTDEHMQSRLDAIDHEKEERISSGKTYEEEKVTLDAQISEIEEKKKAAEEALQTLQTEIARCMEGMEKGKSELIELLNSKASIKARQQRFDTMEEQVNIRKAQLNQRLLARKTEEADLDSVLAEYQKDIDSVNQKIKELKQAGLSMEEKSRDRKKKSIETTHTLEETLERYNKQQSKLESLKNIAERYDGYGNSIRKVMEQKEQNKGLLGVVSDLIQVEKKYEVAIETALGGNIQNIVTEDEETAKKMISFLKENRLGRATFLPLTIVDVKGNFKNIDAIKEPVVIGLANTLVKTEAKYEGVTAYLLGRVIVTENIDFAIKLAKKNHYSLHIVTLEGEYLSPGGSMTGGAFRNNSNLLGRNREIEELEELISKSEQKIKESRIRLEDIKTAQSLLVDDIEANKAELQEQLILQNTAKMNVDRAAAQKNESENVYAGLVAENREIEKQLQEINDNKEKISEEIEYVKNRESQIEEENKKFQQILDEKSADVESATNAVSQVTLELAGIRQKAEFVMENLTRIQSEIRRFDDEREGVLNEAKNAKADVEKKRQDIEEIKKTILNSTDYQKEQENALKEHTRKKEEMSASYKGFFQKQEDVSRKIADLDKEIYRLNSQREKLEEAGNYQTNYMWEEYELTLHAAMELRNEAFSDLTDLKKQIAGIKDDIRKLGDVNVNAIEDYKEISERYGFLKGQHDDLIEAEKTLVGIIEELDTGMRKQFMEKFAEIQREFDKVFKELFGGGKGTLELVEDEDILECGIRIIAQPPGKKLQNMMQMSGGEKSLTAISLLFAIQNLKPSPFCLLDEIEAALDDSNVSRFAKYLHKLTKSTQFIVITHRRGTMAAADRLYGITMQEKGVSTLVSVNLIDDDLSS